jgi:hypothetical protein
MFIQLAAQHLKHPPCRTASVGRYRVHTVSKRQCTFVGQNTVPSTHKPPRFIVCTHASYEGAVDFLYRASGLGIATHQDTKE